MELKRIALGCAMLVGMGGCSQLFRAPTQYVSLPASLSQNTRLSSAVIPGTITAGRSDTRNSMEPMAVLARSQVARANWQTLHPRDLSSDRSTIEPSTTASLQNARREARLFPCRSPACQQ